MEIVLAIAGFVFVLLIHEAGHAIRMIQFGVEVEEVGIGIPIPRVPCLRIPLGKGRPTFCIHPFLVGAYVRPSKRGQANMEALWDEDHISILRAGIAVNVLVGVILSATGLFLAPAAPSTPSSPWTWEATRTLLIAAGAIGILVVLWRKARWTLGILLLGLIIHGMITRTGHSYVGVGGILEDLMKMGRSLHAFLSGVGTLSIIVGLLNHLPIPPMDGWKIAQVRNKEKAEAKLGTADTIAFTGLLIVTVYGFAHDIILFVFRMING